ncbi:MAG: FkbM family methyltransferase [Planctomycetota bacterium]
MDTFIYNEEFKRELREDPHPFGEVSLLESAAETGMTALDIGANRGVTTVALARKVESEGHVYAFEPVPEYYRTLRANLSNNDVHNVTTCRLALGDRAGETDYYKDGGGSGIVRQDGAEKLSVKLTTLDMLVEQKGMGRVDLINMDCEGSELLVMKGGEQTLRTGPVKIFCEIHRGRLAELGQSLDALVRWLEERGFGVNPVLVDDLEKDVSYGDCTHIFASREADAPGTGGTGRKAPGSKTTGK